LLSGGTDDPLFGLSYNQQPLAPYDAITIEPGIYLDGWFGIRVEDDFLVNQESHEFLTADLPRDLDWFQIEVDDYDASMAFSAPADKDEEVRSLLPSPLGLIEIVCLVGLAGWRSQRLNRGLDEEAFLIDGAP